jgi:hypothetical protein
VIQITLPYSDWIALAKALEHDHTHAHSCLLNTLRAFSRVHSGLQNWAPVTLILDAVDLKEIAVTSLRLTYTNPVTPEPVKWLLTTKEEPTS